MGQKHMVDETFYGEWSTAQIPCPEVIHWGDHPVPTHNKLSSSVTYRKTQSFPNSNQQINKIFQTLTGADD